jgi:hypothetical protein
MATDIAIQEIADAADSMNVYRIQQTRIVNATFNEHYVVGITAPYQGKARWILTTTANTASQQNTEIVAGLNA